MSTPSHLFVGCNGDLYDTRNPQWHMAKPLRPVFCRTFRHIANTAQLLATLRNGQYAWPGGYPMYFITSDGAALSFATVRRELANVVDAIRTGNDWGWRVVACDINYEDTELTDEHTGERIESAYGDTARYLKDE